jgi:serine/threonine protein kinase
MAYEEDYSLDLLEKTNFGNMIDEDVPLWVNKLILVQQFNKAAGGFKQVYLYKDMAVGVYEDRGKNDDPLFLNRLIQKDYLENKYKQEGGKRLKVDDKLKQTIDKNIIYPTQEYKKWGYVFLKMDGCYGRELFDILYDAMLDEVKTGLRDGHFLELMKTLSYLHDRNIFLGDIKPENIMLCRGNHLSFIDTDNIIYMEHPNGYFSDFHHTPWYSFLTLVSKPKRNIVYGTEIHKRKTTKVKKEGFRKRDIELNDWVALSICVLMNYDMNMYAAKKGRWGYGTNTYRSYRQRRKAAHYGHIGPKSKNITKLQQLCSKLIESTQWYLYKELGIQEYSEDVLPALNALKDYVQETEIDMDIFNSTIRSNVKKEKLRKGVDEDKWELIRKKMIRRKATTRGIMVKNIENENKQDIPWWEKIRGNASKRKNRRGNRKEQDEEDLQLKF